MRAAEGDRAFVVPRDLSGPSGGLNYNRQVLRVWNEVGLSVAEERIGGTWPNPDDAHRLDLGERLRRYRSVLVDGIIASAAPQQIAMAQASGTEVTVLMHLPLPAETGLHAQQRRFAEAMEAKALKEATLVVCTSAWAQRDVTARYGSVPTAVAAPGSSAAPLAHGSSPLQLLFLGAITARKNPLLLLRALAPLQDANWSLTITGPPGPDHRYLRRVAEEADRYSGRVRLTGALTGAELERAWSAADLLVLPSRAETYGMVVTEAIARGLPALVGAGTGAEEALAAAHGQTLSAEPSALPGRAVDPTDEAAWTESLRGWMHDEDLRRHWRSRAAAHRDRLRPWSQTAKDLRTALRW